MAVILRASSPIWASEGSREGLRKGELATISHKFSFVSPAPPPHPLSRLLSRASRASTFHVSFQMGSLLAG